jgi:regulator of replication initiation timing
MKKEGGKFGVVYNPYDVNNREFVNIQRVISEISGTLTELIKETVSLRNETTSLRSRVSVLESKHEE